MPRFFFDWQDGGRLFSDDEGTELAAVEEPPDEAVRALTGMAKDAFSGDADREFVMIVRDDSDQHVLTATLSLKVQIGA